MSNSGGVFGVVIILGVLLSCLQVAVGQSTDPLEVNALSAIKGSLLDPENNLESWNTGDPCKSNWTGVFCHKTNDTHLHVTELQLFKRNLSGTLAPEVSFLSQLITLDFMWNNLTGSIPKEIGNITTLKLILLNGNQLSGFLPDEIGNLQNLNRLQVDQNQILGPIPKSFANLTSMKHIHMNNNSLSGQIPSELSRMPLLVHLLVDNNNLSGPLPPELAEAPSLKILQADNNNFSGSSIPTTYSNISKLVKLSLRDCSLQGTIPDLSAMSNLTYLDLSWNQLTGSIPTNKLSSNITTIDLSQNMLNGTVPFNFSGFPHLQLLSLKNNHLDGDVPNTIWDDIILTGNDSVILDFQNNSLKTIPDAFNPPENVTVMLNGNPVCGNSDGPPIDRFCQPQSVNQQTSKQIQDTDLICLPCPTDRSYEHNPSSECFCAVPLGVGLRLKSPAITNFYPYEDAFVNDTTSLLKMLPGQLHIENYTPEVGPRINMRLKLFPSDTSLFNESEVVRLRHVLSGWEITLLDIFGPYELLNFTLGSYAAEYPNAASSGLSKAAMCGILASAIAGAFALSAVATILIMRRRSRHRSRTVSRRSLSRFSVKIDGVRCFGFEELARATNNFDLLAQVGQGGYGKVYRGTKSIFSKLILLNGNQLSGFLPDEIGNLQNLNRLQVDQNQILGPIPKSFANLTSMKHIHMNNNSLSGQIPSELSRMPLLVHLLVDNNNLSGPLPPELAEAPSLKILQADNNNFSGSSIPTTYSNISKLVKLSLRNCSLQGTIPDLSAMSNLTYLDLSWNQLTGSIPTNKLSSNITTIDLSQNMLNGTVPFNFSGFPHLQLLSLKNNHLDGDVPNTIWDDIILTGNDSVILDFQNNSLKTIPDAFNPPENVTVMLNGNPVCGNSDGPPIDRFCQPQSVNQQTSKQIQDTDLICLPCPTDRSYEHNPSSECFCAVPLGVGLRLKSPAITNFYPYEDAFVNDTTSLLKMLPGQLHIENYTPEVGPRINMRLKLFPSDTSLFNESEVVRLRHVLSGWEITLLDIFGPYELLNFTLGSYAAEYPNAASSGLSKAAMCGILASAIAGAFALSAVATILIMRRRSRHRSRTVSRRSLSRFSVKIDGVRCFGFEELARATNNFDLLAQVGQGGYGKVYRGTLDDGEIVAIKRAHEDSLQGSKEFYTEIELLSRLHHRNLVSLVGYCDEEDEQMLVYEFMPNGTLRDHLSSKSKRSPGFGLRLHIALGASKGILYLHTDANPPIFHRDVKASNILLDSKFVAKVADFGISRLAPLPDIEGALAGHVSTVVKGTPGYVDPEYFLTHKLTDKSDVYSLGVVFLEMLTGMKPIEHGKNIVREVNKAYKSGNISEIIDKRMGMCHPDCISRFLSLATKCCQDETDARPSMSEIVRELEVIVRLMPEVDLVLLETDSAYMTKSLSTASATGTSFVSQTYGSVGTSSDMLSGALTPR